MEDPAPAPSGAASEIGNPQPRPGWTSIHSAVGHVCRLLDRPFGTQRLSHGALLADFAGDFCLASSQPIRAAQHSAGNCGGPTTSSTTAGRYGSAVDVGIDSVDALIALLLLIAAHNGVIE